MKKSSRYGLVFVVIFFLDRFTKWWAKNYWVSEHKINDYFSLHQFFNRGISWGMFHSETDSIFIAVTTCIVLITIAVGVHAINKWKAGRSILGEVLIMSGSFSNICDRLVYGGVIDFIVLHKNEWTWPVFNVADMSVVLGVAFLFLQEVFFKSE